jgi:N-acetylglucosaminyl-diphospho-decaprenol L-rhamnosyltransferase
MVVNLITKLLFFDEVSQIILTCNIPEKIVLPDDSRILRIDNLTPKGFGANHNNAFNFTNGLWFVVLNPDVILLDNPFPQLLSIANKFEFGVFSPIAINSLGVSEDSWRKFPTFFSLFRKLFCGFEGRYDLPSASLSSPFKVDWVSGLFMIFNYSVYRSLGGFDEKYFLYYEDVDICARAWLSDIPVIACPSVRVIHDAQRSSHTNLKYMRWHIFSMFRFLLKYSNRSIRSNNL